MSISIVKQPQDLMPAYNQMIIAVTGSNQTSPNYQFVADLFIAGTQASRIKVPVNPEGYGIFDIHRHIENAVSFDFNPNWNYMNIATNSFTTYSISFSEEFYFEWEFFDNEFTPGNALGFRGPTGGPEPLFNVGDNIWVNQEAPFTYSQYQGEAEITDIQFITASNYWLIITDKEFLGSTPPNGGTISLANYQLTTVPATASITNKFAWNGVFGFLDFIDYDENNYIPNPSTPSQWLTNVPDEYEVTLDSRMWLLSYKNATNQQKDLMIQSNNGLFRFTSPFSTGLDNERVISNAIGPWNLINATASLQVVSGAFPVISNSTATYSVWLRNQILQQDTETKVFKISRRCSRYEKIQLNFMDKGGSFIPFTFDLVNKHTKNITRTEYQQIYGRYAPAAQAWEYNTWDRGKRNLDTIVIDRFTINSNWLNQSTSDFLMTLFESPEVYWIKEDGTTVAINLTISDVERKQTINDQLVNYTATFELSNKDNKQRG
jgi:hypothetical protein